MSKKLSSTIRSGSERRKAILLQQTLDELCDQLQSTDLTKAFVYQLLTEKERHTIARRLTIASMIQRGETYMAINEKLQVSPNTFTKIKKWLAENLPDYNTALQHTQKAERERKLKRQKRTNNYGAPLSYQRLKHQYPAHFLLFTIAEELIKKL